jgi:hypothetical protein
MRNLKAVIGIIAIAFVTLTIQSCKNEAKKTDVDNGIPQMEMNSEEHHNDEDQDHSSMNHNSGENERNIEASTQKNGETSSIIDAYIQIKNALVAESKDDAAKGATNLLTAFTEFDMTKLTGDTHKEYMEILESAKEHTEHIVKSPIDHQREHFEGLTSDVNDLIALLGTNKTLYKDFCPMANNNKGAFWFSEVKEIKNPYFGSKMMKCGSIKEQIN